MQTDEELKIEIEQFMNEMDKIMSVASTIPSRIRFDPFLFMAWRNRKNVAQ